MTRLPPFGKQFQPVPISGIQVAIGSGAWDFQKRHWSPIMVLPENKEPLDFTWPSDGRPALIHERGCMDDDRLYATAKALIEAGASSVVAIREALIVRGDPRVFFDREVQDVTT